MEGDTHNIQWKLYYLLSFKREHQKKIVNKKAICVNIEIYDMNIMYFLTPEVARIQNDT